MRDFTLPKRCTFFKEKGLTKQRMDVIISIENEREVNRNDERNKRKFT